jgi:hypothetical protein
MCGLLSTEERQEALRLMSCVRFGPDLQAFALDAEHWVEISRKGFRVHYRDADAYHELTSWCGQRVTHVRHVRVDPITKSGRSRHFLELFSSILKGDVTPTQRLPMWQLFEIVDGSVRVRSEKQLPNDPRLANSVSERPVDFQMLASGKVQWRFEDAPILGVVEELPEVVEPDKFPPIEPGNGRIDVTATDQSGVSMAGVTVSLSGLVSTTLQTDNDGVVTFTDLPDGRYDVVGSAKGFTSSRPRVLDLSGSVVPVEIVLKPPARKARMSFSCGMVGTPPSLDDLAARSEVIVHVKIERERSFRRARGSDSDRMEIVTASGLRWMESFKVSSKVKDKDEVLQLGGTVEDGEESESYHARPYASLNVGDEYVLFLNYDEGSDWLGIHLGTEGAFRIRNGRVEPLGSYKLSREWRGRSAKKFFGALRTTLKARTTPSSGRG